MKLSEYEAREFAKKNWEVICGALERMATIGKEYPDCVDEIANHIKVISATFCIVSLSDFDEGENFLKKIDFLVREQLSKRVHAVEAGCKNFAFASGLSVAEYDNKMKSLLKNLQKC